MPCASLHAAAPSQCLIISIIVIILIIIIIIITIRLASDFSTSIFQVPNGAMKVTGSSIHRYRKSELTLTVFFFPRTMRASDNILPNGSLNGLSDDQPWQSWGALFSDPDISVQL